MSMDWWKNYVWPCCAHTMIECMSSSNLECLKRMNPECVFTFLSWSFRSYVTLHMHIYSMCSQSEWLTYALPKLYIGKFYLSIFSSSLFVIRFWTERAGTRCSRPMARTHTRKKMLVIANFMYATVHRHVQNECSDCHRFVCCERWMAKFAWALCWLLLFGHRERYVCAVWRSAFWWIDVEHRPKTATAITYFP